MSILFSLLLAATAPATALPVTPRLPGPAPVRDGVATLAEDAETRWIPFVLTPGNQIRFAMTVDGIARTAILDTGVSYSVLDRRLTDPRRVRALPGGASAIGGTVDIGWIATKRIALGALTRIGGGITVAALPAVATGGAVPVDLLVGRDLTGGHALDIDYANKRFRLLRSGRMPFAGAVSPLAISRDRLVYIGEVTLGTQRLRPMVVDTGDGSAITVTQSGWDAARLPAVPTTTAVSFGLAGAVVSTIVILPELKTGMLTARNVEVRVEPPRGFSDAIGMAGRIGSGFLQQYRVLLDPLAGRMVLLPGPDADRAPVRSTSGLLLGVARDRLRVLHVMKGGPALDAGWREGETICAIDGAAIPPDYQTNPLSAWSAGEPGRVVALRLCDGTERRLRLQSFY